MFCSKCGSDIPEGQEICSKCAGESQEQQAVTTDNGNLTEDRDTKSAVIQQVQSAATDGYARVVGIGTYLGMFVVSWIPVAGFVMSIIWAFDSRNRSKSNFAVVLLILQVLGVILSVLAYSASISLLKTVLKGLANGM